MATITWKTGEQTQFNNQAAWIGNTVPGPGDTGVVSSAGDPAPAIDANSPSSGLLLPPTAGSQVYLASVFEQEGAVYTDEAGNRILVSESTPQAASVAAGENIAGGTLDLLGAGGETELALQDSTLATGSRLNVSGAGYLYSGYSNVLAGHISVGSAVVVDGATEATAPADARGLTSELDIDVADYGSWNDGGSLSGYVPSLTNTGTISVAADSGLFMYLRGTHAFASALGIEDVYTAPATSAFDNQGVIDVSAGGTISAEVYNDSGTFYNNGLISIVGAAGEATSGTFGAFYGGVGVLAIAGGTQTDASQTAVVFDGNQFGGTIDLSDATLTFELGSKPDANQYSGGIIDFTGSRANLVVSTNDSLITSIDDTALGDVFSDTIKGFSAGDTITLGIGNDNNYNDITSSVSWDPTGHVLDVYESANFFGPIGPYLVAALNLEGSYGSSSFISTIPVSNSDGDVNTFSITTSQPAPPCFLAGTKIMTQRGEVAVELLRQGDLVVTCSGRGALVKPIVWIGHSPFDAARHPHPEQVWPIRIRAGALGPDVPRRDLLVSPGHSMVVDGVLMQAERLVNGATIAQDRSIARGVYFHVELARHDILVSDGAPSESYLDVGNRGAFVNHSGVVDLHPDFSPGHAGETCLELVERGPRLDAARARLLARAFEDRPVDDSTPHGIRAA